MSACCKELHDKVTLKCTSHVALVETAAGRAAELAAACPVPGSRGGRGRPAPPALHDEANDHHQEQELDEEGSMLMLCDTFDHMA